MGSLNRIYLIGTLGHTPILQQTRKGQAFCRLSLAVDGPRDPESREQRTDWHSVHVFGRQAEIVSEFLVKGRQVFIEGRLQQRKGKLESDAENSPAGVDQSAERWRTFVTAERVQFLGSGRGTAAGDATQGTDTRATSNA